MADLSIYYQMVEDCITQLGIDPSICRSLDDANNVKEGQWTLKKGSAFVWVDVFWNERNASSYFQVMAPVVEIPTTRLEEFYQEVLDTNHNLFGVSFTKLNNWLYIKIIREVEGLDISEISATLTRVGTYADEYDDYFKEKYYGTPPISGRKSDV
jgi:hypothetical protein